MKKNNLMALLEMGILIVGTAFLGAGFTDIGPWYEGLTKPFFQPPNWLFAPVWIVLYICIGIAGYLILSSDADNKDSIIVLYIINLILNVGWSFLFFGRHEPLLALLELVLLWMTIVVMIWSSKSVSRAAAYLLVPYLLWVTFAGTLNYAIVMLN